MRLYEISDAIEKVLAERTDHETGEIGDDALAELDALEMERDQKALAVLAYAKGEDAEADGIEAEAKRLLERARIPRKRATRLRDYVEQHVERGKKISDARVAISWRKSTRVEIDPGAEEKLPERFVRVKIEPNKVAIGAALAQGETVDGARLVERLGMVVK